MTRNYRWFAMLGLVLMALLFVHDVAEARRSGGGSRSFGGSRRSYSAPRSTPRSTPRTYTSPRSTSQRPTATTQRTAPRTSFGGTRLSSATEYRKSYGTPRRTEQVRLPNQSATSPGYTVHRYGGMGDGFMMGYMMGATPWIWSTPFHPAFYYSRPYIVDNANGTKEVYPPTFSWGKVFLVLLIVGGVAFIIFVVVRGRKLRRQQTATSSFS